MRSHIHTLRRAAQILDESQWELLRFTSIQDLLIHYCLITDPHVPWREQCFDLYRAITAAQAIDPRLTPARYMGDGRAFLLDAAQRLSAGQGRVIHCTSDTIMP